jgi:predicted aldo/keto reductase-like oxidoreductase
MREAAGISRKRMAQLVGVYQTVPQQWETKIDNVMPKLAQLNAYAAAFGTQVCRMCNACEPACPHGVKVSDVFRYRMYEKEYGMIGEGKRLYAQIKEQNRASSCLDCPAPCLQHCDFGVDIKGQMEEAHALLK